MRARSSSHGTRETRAAALSLDRLKLKETARSLRLISHSLLAGQALKGGRRRCGLPLPHFFNSLSPNIQIQILQTDLYTFRRLRAVSLFSWSVEQNVRDTQMKTRVTEGARRATHAQRSHARALPLLNLKKKGDCLHSIHFLKELVERICLLIKAFPIRWSFHWFSQHFL